MSHNIPSSSGDHTSKHQMTLSDRFLAFAAQLEFVPNTATFHELISSVIIPLPKVGPVLYESLKDGYSVIMRMR